MPETTSTAMMDKLAEQFQSHLGREVFVITHNITLCSVKKLDEGEAADIWKRCGTPSS